LRVIEGYVFYPSTVVLLTNPDGVQVTYYIRGSRPDMIVFSMETKSIEEVPIVREYLDVFPEELLRTMCGSRTGGWSFPGVMSD
jgi:hypothetical protein